MRSRHLLWLSIFVWTLPSGGLGSAAFEVVDRILAVVNGEIIALSDVQTYQALFGEGRNAQAILNELIDQRLLLAEARKFEMKEPEDAEVEKAYREVVQRLGSREALGKILRRVGLSEAELREKLKARLMAARLLEQRVTFFALVSPLEVEAYYREHADEFKGQTAEQARSSIQNLLTRQKAEMKRRDYLDRLRARATIHMN